MGEFKNRKLPRLKGYDYSADGYYYVTICTHNKEKIFGVGNGLDHSTGNFAKVAEQKLLDVENHYTCVKIDNYCIMPNHVHAIIVIGCEDTEERSKPFPTLSVVIGQYKAAVSKAIHEKEPTLEVWQKSFYDHVIRDQDGYLQISQYICENPLKWADDELYTQ